MKGITRNLDRRLRMPLLVMVLFTLFACEKGPRFETPDITLGIGPVIDAKVGARVSVPISFNADGGAKSVVVFRNGGFLIEIPIDRDVTEFVYETPVIPESLQEGDEVNYEFLISNLELNDSERLPLTIRAEKYDKITIGSTHLYDIEIPDDNLVTAGTVIKLVKGRNYYLASSLTFASGSELNIEEGVHVYMDAEAANTVDLLVEGEMSIIGTASTPVVFTSSKTLLPDENPRPGDWGTFRINGTGPSSNNGIVNYLRMEYGGGDAFRFSDVGVATNLSHIQVFKAGGMGLRFGSGNVGLKYLVATDCEGGSFRIGDEYEGMMQFVVTVSSERFGENDDFTIRETAKPTIANATILGAGTTVSNTHGIRMRADSEPKMYNTIVAQFPRRAVRAHDNVAITDLNGKAVFAYSYVFDVSSQAFRELAEGFAPGAAVNFHNSTDAISGIAVADFVPDAEQSSAFDPSAIDPFFTASPYVGAVRNANEDWTRGWVKNPDGSIR